MPLTAAVVVTVVTELTVTESSRSLLFDRSREDEDWLVLLELLRLFLDPPGVVLRAVPRPAPTGGFSSTLKDNFVYHYYAKSCLTWFEREKNNLGLKGKT